MTGLGIVLLILVSWHFLVGNLAVGVLMILYAYLLARIWKPERLAEGAREHARLGHALARAGQREEALRIHMDLLSRSE